MSDEPLVLTAQRALERGDIATHRRLLARAAQLRLLAGRITPRDNTCPACGHALKWRYIPYRDAPRTCAICPSCNFMHEFEGDVRSDSRLVGEPMTPGVTGKPRGTTRVVMRGGQIVRVEQR